MPPMTKHGTQSRFRFIAHALDGEGGFMPSVSYDALGNALATGASYLVRYPRETTEKFARRNEIAFYASPLRQAVTRFCGFIAEKSSVRQFPHELYELIRDDADGKGNSLDVFWQGFMQGAKARGSMLLLVDMPQTVPTTLAGQIRDRAAPFLTMLPPEIISDWSLGQDGQFTMVEFIGTYTGADGKIEDCVWRFTRSDWRAVSADGKDRILDQGEIAIGRCPVISFTEAGDFPHFGDFAPIASLSKRLFNLDSELDELLRSQTFSPLTMQVPNDTTSDQKIEAAKVAGQTIGTGNLMLYTGQAPAYIAPPDGPARVLMDRIDKLQRRIDDIGLAVASPNQQESGISMQMRFHSINAALGRFAERMEDFERRMWDLCAAWLGMRAAPTISWPRDFTVADVARELEALTLMNSNAMPRAVIAEQQKRVVSLQFAGLDDDEQDTLMSAIDGTRQERETREDNSTAADAEDNT